MPRSTARARPATSRTEPPSTPAPPPADAEKKPARNALKLKVKVPRAKRFVALAGNIGAGKTTAAKLISQGFGFELFDEPVIDNRFLRDYYGDMSRWSFTLQLEFLIRRVEHHELIHSVRKSCVQDRTLYEDPEIFAKYLHGLGHMTNAELDLYYEYFQRLSRHIVRPDKVICFDVPSEEVLLQRIRTRGRAEEKGIGRPFLKGLNGYYAGFPQVLQEKYGVECLVVDVSKSDIRKGAGREEFMDRVSAFLA
ncbi:MULTISPECIES: deoxynucleoside kinase [unclassified Corallococcus]|uniref:deoxynucleoside kinase n=1 Tax=unclassified Corallococcus TaxID=2685029 RepID=UPI001A8CCBB1|nr:MULTISPECIES: deoxynucleoside kinase [unclassified Corallococcus]MBN9683935.1 deoxynucleoside kinase [Corallococcus sp. NCSPR001]WAS84565.1 deoxynucleoside kinase [Corallococcus sp. NCRR]